MTSMRHVILASAIILGFATVTAAQTSPPSLTSLTTGQRVRVHSITEPRQVVGGVSAVDSEFLAVVPDGLLPIKLPVRSIAAVDISRGRKRNWLKGLGIGLALGVGVGFAFSVDAANCGPETVYFCSRGEALTAGTVLFGGIGAGVGAFIKSERWTPFEVARPSQ
jgi:hypothetical protein